MFSLFRKEKETFEPDYAWYENARREILALARPDPAVRNVPLPDGDGSGLAAEGGGKAASAGAAGRERLAAWIRVHRDDTFQEELMARMKERGISASDFLRASRIDKKRFGIMKKERDYDPSFSTALASCIALKLDRDEAQNLMFKAGHALGAGSARELAVLWCLDRKVGDWEIADRVIADIEGDAL